MTDEEIREKVIRHDIELKNFLNGVVTLTNSITDLSRGLTKTIEEKYSMMDNNLKESFIRVHERSDAIESRLGLLEKSREERGCPALALKAKETDVLNIAVFGKDGRGGLIFEMQDVKKFIYKAGGAITIANIFVGSGIAYILR